MSAGTKTGSSASMSSLGNHFLISMSALEVDYFCGTVTYLVDHSAEGAFGLVINQPLDCDMAQLFRSIPGAEHCLLPVYDGGPVSRDSLFFLHSSDIIYQHSQPITPELVLTTSMDLVHALIADQGPKNVMPLLGYAGWAPGQLENELMEDFWLLIPAHPKVIFNSPNDQKAQAAAALLGIDLNLISRSTGHG